MHKHARYGKGSEKPKESSKSKSASDGSKDEDEEKYIENGSKNNVPPTDDDEEEEEENASSGAHQEQKPRDLSNRPDHYNTMFPMILRRSGRLHFNQKEVEGAMTLLEKIDKEIKSFKNKMGTI